MGLLIWKYSSWFI